MIKKIDHIVFTSKDLEKCKEFYIALGFKVVNPGNRLELYAGDFKINVHQYGAELSPHAGTIAPGSLDICFEVDDLEVFILNAQKKGIKPETEIVERNGVRGKMRSAYYRDTEGNLLEFSQYST